MSHESLIQPKKVFGYIEKTKISNLRNEKEITDVISNMSKELRVGYQIIDCKYFNISKRSDLINANYIIRTLNFNYKKISLVIPAYNEETSIEEVINDFKSYNIFNEIIVVDNNSKDKTYIKATAVIVSSIGLISGCKV